MNFQAGLASQVSTGAYIPPSSLMMTLGPASMAVRDVLGCHRVVQGAGLFGIPAPLWDLYTNVAAAGMSNIITLFGGDQSMGLGSFQFPTTDAQRAAWTEYAVYCVSHDGVSAPTPHAANIPNLKAVTIWNELNGRWTGGIVDIEARQRALVALGNVVVPAIRKANPAIAIGFGSYVGHGGAATWLGALQKYGFDFKTVDWLDTHPYVGNGPAPAPGKRTPIEDYAHDMAHLRSLGIVNPCWFTEYGGPIAEKMGIDFFAWFKANVLPADPVAAIGGNFYAIYAGQEPNQSLTTGNAKLTGLGRAFAMSH